VGTTRNRRWTTSGAVLLVGALSLAACGGSSDGGSDAATSGGPDGTPIKLSVMATATGITGAPQVFDGAQAAVKALNAAGGVKDAAGGKAHPLELVECRVEGSASTSTPQVALKCATDAIKAGVVADVGKYLFAQLAIEAYQKANTPLIGTIVVDSSDITSPAVFSLSTGVLAIPGAAVVLEQQGAKTLGYVSADNPAGRGIPQFIKPALKASKLTIEQYLPLDPSADVSAVVSKLVQSNPDGILLAQTASASVRITQALRSAGYKGKVAFSGLNLNDAVIKQLGPNTNDLVAASSFPAVTETSNAQIKKYNDDMDKYASGKSKDEFSLNAWFSVNVAGQILGTLKEYTPAAMTAATKGYQVDTGLVPAFTLGQPGNFLKLPSIPRGTLWPLKIDGGKPVTAGDGFDINAVVTGG
jgi:ABC-type branched-subunit amino acid transport system substrate-binding protein